MALCPHIAGAAFAVLTFGDLLWVAATVKQPKSNTSKPLTCFWFVVLLAGLVCATLTAFLFVGIVQTQRASDTFTVGPDAGLSGFVKVYTERSTGVLHIEANSSDPGDLFFVQGMVTAQTRTFQMELQRRLSKGRLAEMVGEAAVPQDLMQRTFRFAQIAEQTFAQMKTEVDFAEEIMVLERYTAGVNYFINSPERFVPPIELRILSWLFGKWSPDHLEPWTPADSIAWVLIMSYGLSGNLPRELLRAKLLTDQGLDVRRVMELVPAFDLQDFPTIVQAEDVCEDPSARHDQTRCELPSTMETWLNSLTSSAQPEIMKSRKLDDSAFSTAKETPSPIWNLRPSNALGVFGASNNWVVSGNLTASETPLVANDPHLELTAPNIWLLVHLKDETHGVDVIGASFVGMPMVVLGRNKHMAWGVTNTGADVQDLFLLNLTADGKAYIHNGTSVSIRERSEELKVAGESTPRQVTFRLAPHYGPVISDHGIPDVILQTPASDTKARLGGHTVALRWTSLLADEPEHFDTSMVAFFRMAKARDLDEARQALKLLVAPGQNFVMANSTDIGYQMTGRFPVRVQGHSGLFPVPGNGSYDWGAAHYLPYEELPNVTNPKQGFVATANNRAQPPCFPHVPSCDYDSIDGYRAKRISQMLQDSRGSHSVSTMQAIQHDMKSLFAEELKEVLAFVCHQTQDSNAVKLCEQYIGPTSGYTFEMAQGSIAATFFNLWVRELSTFAANGTGSLYWAEPYVLATTYRRALAKRSTNSSLDQQATYHHSTDDPLSFAASALERIAAQYAEHTPPAWGSPGMHETCFHSAIFDATPLACLFSRRVPHGGDMVTVNVGLLSYPSFLQIAGSSFRAVMSLGGATRTAVASDDYDDGLSVIVNALGQSGSILSPHYDDMAVPWSNGEYFHMSISDRTANGPTDMYVLSAP